MKAVLIALVLGLLVVAHALDLEEDYEMDLYEEEAELTEEERTTCKKCNNKCYDTKNKVCYPSSCPDGRDALCNKGKLPCWRSPTSYSCYDPKFQWCCYDPWWDSSNGPIEYTLCPVKGGYAYQCCHDGSNHKLKCYDPYKYKCCHSESGDSHILGVKSHCNNPDSCPWWED